MAARHAVVSGHYWASQAGFQILEAGGNAFDAGVAVGLATNVLESEMTCFAGVAPSMMRVAATGETINFVGVGPWPQAASAAYFRDHHGGKIPQGLLNCVVPAAPDIWLSVLERFGTFSFADVAAPAIRFARDGFPMYPFMAEVLDSHREEFQGYRDTANIFLPGGELPRVGELFYQTDLAKTLQFLVDEEGAAGGSREVGISAARRAFYHGDIASAIVAQQREYGGLMTREDLSGFRAQTEAPVKARFGEYDVFGCGPWSQGPMVLMALQMLDGLDLGALEHNDCEYVHRVVEALKLAAADREAYFGDPDKVDVPLAELMSDAYCAARRVGIGERACAQLPNAGPISGVVPPAWVPDPSSNDAPGITAAGLETSYFCVIDAAGNLFSATPSDPTISGMVIPGTGLTTSMWGSRGHTDESHPARVGPGWRPRMSANPMLAIHDNGDLYPIGSPGSEVLGQAQLQVFLNMAVFGMDPQRAVEAPRFASYGWPASAVPHSYSPGEVKLEALIGEPVGSALSARGHRVTWWPERTWRAGSVGTIHRNAATGVLHAGADPRRSAYAIGW
jgi:gamma-glutamyltranspeptidase/glutathione hydrolase